MSFDINEKHMYLVDENVIALLRLLTNCVGEPSYKEESKSRELLDKFINDGTMDDYFTKTFVRKFSTQARTLSKEVIGYNTHAYYGNFNLYAYEHEDYYRWVNYFICIYDTGAWVLGDFESVVFASSEDTYKAFKNSVDVKEWDYYDI
jgi:hypothetical protein